tara:strand:+ start:1355 stop:1714 length:360 start_codon:yes stop_codon:yes gene_type:complete
MYSDFDNVYDMIEHAIEYSFQGKMQLKFYDFLKSYNAKKYEIDEFLNSSTAHELSETILELEEYLKGGSDSNHKQLREGYGHIPKPQARKIKNYLIGILEDAMRYSNDKKRGRRKKDSK